MIENETLQKDFVIIVANNQKAMCIISPLFPNAIGIWSITPVMRYATFPVLPEVLLMPVTTRKKKG